jgi:hypothetical protein
MKILPVKSKLLLALSLFFVLVSSAFSAVTVQTEHLNPANPVWNFKTIPRPSKSDIAAGARVTMVGNQFESAAADGSVLVNGVMPNDSLDLAEGALLNNGNTNDGSLLLDLGSVQPVAAVTQDHAAASPKVDL